MLHYSPYSELSKFGRFQVSSSAKITIIDCYCESCDVICSILLTGKKLKQAESLTLLPVFLFFFLMKFLRWLDKKIRYCHNIAIPKLCGARSFPLQDILHHISHIIQNGCISVREEFQWDWMDLKNSENGWLLNTISMVYMWLEK